MRLPRCIPSRPSLNVKIKITELVTASFKVKLHRRWSKSKAITQEPVNNVNCNTKVCLSNIVIKHRH